MAENKKSVASPSSSKQILPENSKALIEANTCIALGAGVGTLGVGSAVLLGGAICPLCVFIAPGLMGVGLYQRWRCKTGKHI